MEYITDNQKWQPTREDYLKLEEKYRDLENSYIHLYNVRYCLVNTYENIQKSTNIFGKFL